MAWDRGWSRGPAARFKAAQREKKRRARRHVHICDFCENEKPWVCCDYHCVENRKRICHDCRRRQKYHIIDPDIFRSVELAAKARKTVIAIHMESTFEDGVIVHRFWNHWSDGTRTLMTLDEVTQWSTNPNESSSVSGVTGL